LTEDVDFEFFTIPRLAEGGTVVCIGGGPSLTREDVEFACSHDAFILGINDAYRIAPRLDALYGCDARWWLWHPAAMELDCLLLSTAPELRSPKLNSQFDRLNIIGRGADLGLDLRPDHICTGSSSGYQAIGVAVHCGARRIVLIGYDYFARPGRVHWFGDHPEVTPNAEQVFHEMMAPKFSTLVEPLCSLGVEVWNATPDSALSQFPKVTIEEALAPCESR